jgi:phosphoribosyl 1,2-cyclic phosphodiesterase
MPLELCILASGSSGNAALLRSPAGVMLIDLGIGPRTTAKRLQGTGVTLADISAVCLTHLDRDHFNPHWIATLIRQNIRVYCHAEKAEQLARAAAPDQTAAFERLIQPFNSSPFSPLHDASFNPIHLAHDLLGSHGFLIDGFNYRIGYATDLGRVPVRLIETFRDLDLLALESNYDPVMQEQSPRPLFLKRRITNGQGHLSNSQALAAIKQILNRARRLPDHIVLLHRSRQCNCPNLLRALFSRDPRIAPRLTLAEPFERSPWLRRRDHAPAGGEQLMLSF